ncbi:MAG: ATP-binding cassette domain-containing protein [Alkalicoccus sp.]|nr:MAG: ATP-binding cassette domain-containing protein [Alkalicoccus sp.]
MGRPLKLDQVDVKYGREEILRQITLQFESPRIYGLLGRDGMGKTTIMELLASFQKPSRGKVLYGDEPLFENASLMPLIYFVYWEDYHDDYQTGEKKIREAAAFRPHFDMDYAFHLAEMMNLQLSRPVKKYSRGKAAALQLSLGLASRAPVTLIDEVFPNMDAPAREFFYEELLNEQKNHPRLFILSSHLISETEHLYDEVVILHHREIILNTPYHHLVSQGVLLTGPAVEVEAFTQDYPTAGEKLSAGTMTVEVYGTITDDFIKKAEEKGLQVQSLSLQKIFTQLTREEDKHEEK